MNANTTATSISPTAIPLTAPFPTLKHLESYLFSKSGNTTGGEDRTIINHHEGYVGVVDGATTKSERKFHVPGGASTVEMTGGELLAVLIKMGIEEHHFRPQSDQFVSFVESSLMRIARDSEIDLSIPLERPHASFALYSKRDHAVYVSSDCQVGFIFAHEIIEIHTFRKLVDDVLANVRAQANIDAIALHGSEAEFIQKIQLGLAEDVGRKKIGPFLKRQLELVGADANDSRIFISKTDGAERDYTYGELAYFPFNGKLSAAQCVQVLPVPAGALGVFLASDWNPLIASTFDLNMQHLRKLMAIDPLGIRERKTTKGYKRNVLYPDDVSWMKGYFS